MISETKQAPGPIVIVGFMGSGKTTVSRELARLLSRRAIDLDQMISARAHRSPGEIIEQSGEDTFRRMETEMLRQVLNQELGDTSAGVVALGGGAWTIPENRELIRQHEGLTVWLDVPFALCWERIEASKELRPLAQTRESAERLYNERRPLYELASIHIAASETLNATEAASRIARVAIQ